jgi:hypothetical protein
VSATRAGDVQLWQGYVIGEQLRATIAGSFREGFIQALDLMRILIQDDPSLAPKALEYCRQGIDEWGQEMGVNTQDDPPHRAGPAEVRAWLEKMEGGGLASREDLRELLSLL